jgi:SAM-dependent methyltransferase
LAKQGEVDYLARAGPAHAEHARGKPFSDPHCAGMLVDFGGILMVIPQPPARVLDFGCGTGWTSVMLARRGYDVVGQDIAPDMIALAEANAREAQVGARFVVSDYEGLSFKDEFDVGLFYDCLHHAVDPRAALASAFRALKPGGVLVTLEPGKGHGASEASAHAVAAFDVTERDMPPQLVARLGREVGFGGASIHPMPKDLAHFQFQKPIPAWCPRWLAPLYRWLALGALGIVVGRGHGGMVVLRKGGTPLPDARAMAMAFFTSPEYVQKNTSDRQFVTDLYRLLFTREPDSAGLDFWAGQIGAGQPRSEVLATFLASPEFANARSSRFGAQAVQDASRS